MTLLGFGAKRNRRKGQMFVIGAIIIITGLIMAKSLFVSFSYAPGFSSDIDYNTYVLENIETEYRRLADMNKFYGTNNLDEFSLYLRERVNGFGILYLYAEAIEDGYLLTIGNYLGHDIDVSIGSSSERISDKTYTQITTSLSDIVFEYGQNNVSLSLSDGFLFYVATLNNGNMVKENTVV